MYPSALKNPEIRKLLLAQLPADFSDWLDFVAIGTLLAFVWDAPSIAYALLAVGMGAPYLIVGPVAGALVDRVQIKTVLIFSNLGRAAVTGAFFFAGDWPVLILLVALRSSVDSFFTPAKQAALQALTDEGTRASANGLSHGINQASKIVAPGLGGTFLIWFAPMAIFLVNAVISASAALLAMRLARIERLRETTVDEPGGLFAGIGGGLALVRSNLVIRRVILIMAATFFALFIYDTFIAPLTQQLGFEQQHLGYALAAVGAGGVVGAVVFSILPDLKHPQLWIAGGTALSGVLAVALGVFDLVGAEMTLALLLAIFAILGVTFAMAVVPVRVILQDTVPETRMGSVTALSEAANTIALLSAPFAGALLVSLISVGAPFVVGGGVLLLVTLMALRLKLD
ncbi:MFS transporter [Gymnodinialimonas sp. 2305UL16-5]|uniref:MFS transporter n=1 Tax=Gymnodinialimonas mytili TaxID=3126503 RepID=UPI0030AC5D63